jgi:hypothetical protein
MLEMGVATGLVPSLFKAAGCENPFSRAAGGWSNPFCTPAKALGNGQFLLPVRPGNAGISTI